MKNFTFYVATFLCLFLTKATAQETFEQRAKMISDKIEQITKEEKDALKFEVEAVNKQLELGLINATEADDKKIQLAQSRARSIETRVAEAQEELNQLVKDKVDGKIKERDTTGRYSLEINSPIRFRDKLKKDWNDTTRVDSRTTSQFVFATGFNNLVTNGNLSDSDFEFNQSAFYEWGLSFTTRILNNSNLLQAKYGLSLMYNNLRPTDNRYFEVDGDQTYLVTSDVALKHSRLRNVYLAAPVFLEFDLGKSRLGTGFRKQQGLRIGVGGYGGIRLKSKQILKFDDEDGNRVVQKTKGDFNANNFIYGVSSYIGWEHMSLYVKYDLNPMFEDNAVDQNNISMGIRFDFD